MSAINEANKDGPVYEDDPQFDKDYEGLDALLAKYEGVISPEDLALVRKLSGSIKGEVPGDPDWAGLDWERLRSGNYRALYAEHQDVFDKFRRLYERVDSAPSSTVAPSLTFEPVHAALILLCRDALLRRDLDDAYHWLYTLDSKQIPHDPFKPWADLERIAGDKYKATEGPTSEPSATVTPFGPAVERELNAQGIGMPPGISPRIHDNELTALDRDYLFNLIQVLWPPSSGVVGTTDGTTKP